MSCRDDATVLVGTDGNCGWWDNREVCTIFWPLSYAVVSGECVDMATLRIEVAMSCHGQSACLHACVSHAGDGAGRSYAPGGRTFSACRRRSESDVTRTSSCPISRWYERQTEAEPPTTLEADSVEELTAAVCDTCEDDIAREMGYQWMQWLIQWSCDVVVPFYLSLLAMSSASLLRLLFFGLHLRGGQHNVDPLLRGARGMCKGASFAFLFTAWLLPVVHGAPGCGLRQGGSGLTGENLVDTALEAWYADIAADRMRTLEHNSAVAEPPVFACDPPPFVEIPEEGAAQRVAIRIMVFQQIDYYILRRASNRRLPQPERLAKRSKASQPAPAVWDKWPILRPYDLMKEFASSGLESELCLDAINHFSECFIFLGKVCVGRLVIHTAPETLLQVWPGGLATVLVAGIL